MQYSINFHNKRDGVEAVNRDIGAAISKLLIKGAVALPSALTLRVMDPLAQ